MMLDFREGSAGAKITKLLSDGVPRTAAKIIEELQGCGSSDSALWVALTDGARRGNFSRHKADKKYVYGLTFARAPKS
jgi:hypothetical protein